MHLEEYKKIQIDQIRKSYQDPQLYPFAIKNEDAFFKAEGLYSKIYSLDGCKRENVFIREYRDDVELWVRRDYSLYRRAFKIF